MCHPKNLRRGAFQKCATPKALLVAHFRNAPRLRLLGVAHFKDVPPLTFFLILNLNLDLDLDYDFLLIFSLNDLSRSSSHFFCSFLFSVPFI